MLETIREFGWEKLRELGEELQVRESHADVFYRLIVDDLAHYHTKRGELNWFERVLAEESNLRQALMWFARHGNALALHQLSCALQEFWTSRAQFAEVRNWLEQALQQQEGVPAPVRARTLREAAQVLIRTVDYASAVALADESLRMARESDDLLLLYSTLQTRGTLAERQGDLVNARIWLEESLSVGREERSHESGNRPQRPGIRPSRHRPISAPMPR